MTELEELRAETARGVANEGWGVVPAPAAVWMAFTRIAELED
jgi:hypothetical protein